MRILLPKPGLFCILGTLCLLVACTSKKEEKIAAPVPGAAPKGAGMPMKVEAFVVKTTAVSEKLEVPGSIIPFEATELRPEVSGSTQKITGAAGYL